MKLKSFAIFGTFLCTSRVTLAKSAVLDQTSLIYEFPNNTWVENIAARNNGELLLSIVGTPQLFTIDPSAPSPRQPVLIHEFTDSLDVFGIAEYQTDRFAVLTGNFSFETGDLGLGSWAVWSQNLNTKRRADAIFNSESCKNCRYTACTNPGRPVFAVPKAANSSDRRPKRWGDISTGY